MGKDTASTGGRRSLAQKFNQLYKPGDYFVRVAPGAERETVRLISRAWDESEFSALCEVMPGGTVRCGQLSPVSRKSLRLAAAGARVEQLDFTAGTDLDVHAAELAAKRKAAREKLA